jgi:two-component system, OmpR family, response regulator RegX3
MTGRLDATTTPAHPEWLALVDPGVPLGHLVGIRTETDPAVFLGTLAETRPRIVVVAEPPASRALVEGVATERRRRPALRIVHLAPDAAVDRRLRALRLGYDDALPLGIAPDEFVGRLALLDERARAAGRGASLIPLGDDLELDLLAHELRRGGNPVHLRPKEFGLLALLAGHPGRAYTRRQLLDRVWGDEHDGDPRTVDVHVRWLRAKIEPEPARPIHLVTLRGIGYRLDPPGSR